MGLHALANDALDHITTAAVAKGGWRAVGESLLETLGHADLIGSPCGRAPPAASPGAPPRFEPAVPVLWPRCATHRGRPLQRPALDAASGEADLSRLCGLLQWLHGLCTTRPDEFRVEYAAVTQEAMQLVRSADFSSHCLPRSGALPSVLHFAAGCGCLEVCAALLARCGRLNFAVDPSGRTPLLWATPHGLCNTLCLLLRHSADVEHSDDAGQTALHEAASRGLVETCRVLLTASGRGRGRAALELRTLRGRSVLHAAAAAGHSGVVELLLAAGSAVEAEVPEGRTALHLAAMEGHSAVVDVLLAARPELQSLEDVRGWRALDYARERGLPCRDALYAEDQAQNLLHSQWRQHFEPVCRARLNVPACDAFLEIGRPHLLGHSGAALRIACRLADSLALAERFVLELAADSAETVAEKVVALPAQLTRRRACGAIQDIELLVPLRRPPLPAWDRLGKYRFRVVAELKLGLAARFNLEHCKARSPWTKMFAGALL